MTTSFEMNKKEKEQIEIEIIQMDIEIAKTELDRYVQAIVRSSFIDNCTGGAYFHGLFTKDLLNGAEAIRSSNKSDKQKEVLRRELFIPSLFVKSDSKVERLKANLKYYQSLVDWAKYNLNKLSHEDKEKIVMDCLEQQNLWNNQFERNSKLYATLTKKSNNQPKTTLKTKSIRNKK